MLLLIQSVQIVFGNVRISSSYVRLAVAGVVGWPASHWLRLGPPGRKSRHRCRRSGAEGSVHRPEAGQSAFSVLSCGSPPIVFVLVSPVVFSHEEASSPAIWAGVLLPSFYRRRAGAVKPENYTNSAQKNCENKPENDDFLRTLQQTVRTSQRNFATGAAGAFRPPPDAPSAMRGSRPE